MKHDPKNPEAHSCGHLDCKGGQVAPPEEGGGHYDCPGPPGIALEDVRIGSRREIKARSGNVSVFKMNDVFVLKCVDLVGMPHPPILLSAEEAAAVATALACCVTDEQPDFCPTCQCPIDPGDRAAVRAALEILPAYQETCADRVKLKVELAAARSDVARLNDALVSTIEELAALKVASRKSDASP